MSYTYHLLTTQTFLPASYGIDITATPTSGVPVTRSFIIDAILPGPSQQTVRSVHQLLTVLFADGQLPSSITEQDCRDMLVSLSLETADLSQLPTSSTGLASGRVYVDNNVFRVVP